jgi:hypothetical protein
MKRIIYILGLFTALLMASCADDKGNYDYHDIVEASIDPSAQTTFSVNQYDYLDITPDIKFSQNVTDASKFSYKWVIYLNAWSKDASEIQQISTEKNLHYQITEAANASPYAVVLYVTNTEDNTVSQIKYTVTVSATISSGILAMHESGSGSDFDYIATKNAIPTLGNNVQLSNAYAAANGGSPFAGKPLFIAAARENRTVLNNVYLATDQSMVQLSGIDFTESANFSELFYTAPSTWAPKNIFRGGQIQYATIMVNGNEVRCINSNISPRFSPTFSDPVSCTSALGSVTAAPYIYVPDEYQAPVAGNAVLYDTTGKRFFKYTATYTGNNLDKFTEQSSSALFDVNNIGKDICYFGRGYNKYGYAVFKTGNTYELYSANFNMASGTYSYDAHWNRIFTPNPDAEKICVAKYDMSSLPEIASAKFFDCAQYGPVLMYATEHNIYACTIGTSTVSASIINDAFPSNEVITSMMIFNPNPNIQSALSTVAGTILYVATWNGTTAKIYEFSIARNNCQMTTKTPLNTFTVSGKVVNMCIKLQGLG